MVLPPDQKSLKIKTLRASFILWCIASYLGPTYSPPDANQRSWELVDSKWEDNWYEGNPLPTFDAINSNFHEESE